MALIRYSVEGNSLTRQIHSHSYRPGRTVLSIGSNPDYTGKADCLLLPAKRGIAADHAVIVETKTAALFVLLDRGTGQTRVNSLSIAHLKVLRHLDRIALGGSEGDSAVELVFEELDAERPNEPFRCLVCKKEYAIEDRDWAVFSCPRCPSQYCSECVLIGGLKCRCGFDFELVIGRVLRSAEIKGLLPKAQRDRLTIERVQEGSALLSRHCAMQNRTRDKSTNRLTNFQIGNDVVYCPECEAPYHRSCWLSLAECLEPHCERSPLAPVRAAIFGFGEEGT